jgi:hypothetical protein
LNKDFAAYSVSQESLTKHNRMTHLVSQETFTKTLFYGTHALNIMLEGI